MRSQFLLTGIIGFCCFVNPILAQQEILDTAAFQEIRVAELYSSQIPMIAHYLTDVSGSRLTNSPGFFKGG